MSFGAYATVCMLAHDVKGTCACTSACLCMYMCACVRASVFMCLCFCVCLYALGGGGGKVCICRSVNHVDCGASIPVVVGNNIPDQLMLVKMTLEYRELWDSYTKPANLDDGDDVMGQRSSPYQYILVVMLIFSM